MKIADGQIRLSASDVASFVACQHLARLDLLNAKGELASPREMDRGFQALVQRGEAQEKTVLDRFRADGLHVTDIRSASDNEAQAATVEALRSGADVIYQAVLLRGQSEDEAALFGRPDFLVRAALLPAPDGEPRPGGDHHEVVDAKLARSAKARAVLQTAFYTSLLAQLQGVEPRWMHLALGNGEFASFKVKDYAAYERQVRRLIGTFVANDPGENPPSDPYPDPVEHCAICRWSDVCAARRRVDDDLSLIAGITKRQRRELKEAGIVGGGCRLRGPNGLQVCPNALEPIEDVEILGFTINIIGGVTVGDYYLSSDGNKVTERLLHHERRHSDWWAIMGAGSFMAEYAVESRTIGPCNFLEYAAGWSSGRYSFCSL